MEMVLVPCQEMVLKPVLVLAIDLARAQNQNQALAPASYLEGVQLSGLVSVLYLATEVPLEMVSAPSPARVLHQARAMRPARVLVLHLALGLESCLVTETCSAPGRASYLERALNLVLARALLQVAVWLRVMAPQLVKVD